MIPIILKYFLNNKNNWLIAKNHIKTLWPLLFSAEIGNTQLTKYAAQKHQQQQVNDRNTLVVSGQSIWRRQAMPRFCIRRNKTMAREETSRQRQRQADQQAISDIWQFYRKPYKAITTMPKKRICEESWTTFRIKTFVWNFLLEFSTQ